jgi:hypothetical protein
MTLVLQNIFCLHSPRNAAPACICIMACNLSGNVVQCYDTFYVPTPSAFTHLVMQHLHALCVAHRQHRHHCHLALNALDQLVLAALKEHAAAGSNLVILFLTCSSMRSKRSILAQAIR